MYIIMAIWKETLLLVYSPKLGKKNSEIYNIGLGKPIPLKSFIRLLEKIIGKKAKKNFVSMQKGDVRNTYSSNKKMIKNIKFKPNFSIEHGLREFVKWYKDYYLKKWDSLFFLFF